MHSSVPPQIPGEQIPHGEADPLRSEVAHLLGRDNLRFPGAQPVSFSREHIAELQRNEYFMCEKTDGVRCLLFLYFRDLGPQGFEPATILIDRKNNYYDVTPPLRFPHYQFKDDPDKYLFNTILDGEFVHDKVPGEPKARLIFYAFDCLVIDGTNLTGRPYDKRIGRMKEQIFQPYYRWVQKNGRPPAEEPFRVKEKNFVTAYSVQEMFNNVLPKLPHGNDGLVFTCKSTPYHFGTDKHILKWKPPHENTIDFKFKLGEFPVFDPEDGEDGPICDYDAMPDRIELLVMHSQNNYKYFADLHVTPEEWETLKGLEQRLDGRIIECFRDNGRWRFKKEDDGTPRWRDDKKDANHISTVQSVLESIEDPVTEQDLLSAAPVIKQAVYRLRAEEAERQKQLQAEHAEKEREMKKRKFSQVSPGGLGDMNGGP
jgi:mRNA guanylyltransferase